jgi:predicted  nucleic acid-binding Zn-ribbon protein
MSLQTIDQAISGKKREAEATMRQLRELEAHVKQREAEAAQLGEEHAGVKAQQREIERERAEIDDKMKDRRMRLQRVRSDKEMQATQREIDVMKERTTQLDEHELQILEVVETLDTRLAEVAENLRGGQDALSGERESLVARGAELTQQIDRETVARVELAEAVDANLRRRYDAIFARRGGTAVVLVNDGACQGCHMRVPPQLFNQILRGGEVFDCPSCHRILFASVDNHDGA